MTARRVLRATAPSCLAFVLTFAASSCMLHDGDGVRVRVPVERVVHFEAKPGGWTLYEIAERIQEATGVRILWESYNGSSRLRPFELGRSRDIPSRELVAWLQDLVTPRRLVVVPLPPIPPRGEVHWFVMDQSNPALTKFPTCIAEDDVEQFARRSDAYVMTTLTVTGTRDTTAVRCALSPLSTSQDGIGRIQDIPGAPVLIVGDHAGVVRSMKRIVDLVNDAGGK